MAKHEHIRQWDDCLATQLFLLFYEIVLFSDDMSFWDTSSFDDMIVMFLYVSFFNLDLSRYGIGRTNNVISMLRSTISFGQKICWELSRGNHNVSCTSHSTKISTKFLSKESSSVKHATQSSDLASSPTQNVLELHARSGRTSIGSKSCVKNNNF